MSEYAVTRKELAFGVCGALVLAVLKLGSGGVGLGRCWGTPPAPSRIMTALLDRVRRDHGELDPYALLVFTNHPHH